MPSVKEITRKRRHQKIFKKVRGTAARPRLVVFKSNMSTYVQLIDDDAKKTLTCISDVKDKKPTNMESAKKIGNEVAKKAKELKVDTCVFDRNGYKYHGIVKALADAAREGGLKF